MRKPANSLDERIEALTQRRDELLKGLFTTSDGTQKTLTHMQNGLYMAKLATSIFSDLTNSKHSPKKRFQKATYTALTTIGLKFLKSYFLKQQTP